MKNLESFIKKYFPVLKTRLDGISLEITSNAKHPYLHYKISVDYSYPFRVYVFDDSLRAFKAYVGELTKDRALDSEVIGNVIIVADEEFPIFLKMLVTGKIHGEVADAKEQVAKWRSSFSAREQMKADFKAVLEHLRNQ